jgi:ABC-type phosphate transport system permease subunit
VTPYLVREAVDALRLWEPRLTDVSVSVAFDVAQVILTVTWTAALSGWTTQVVLG